MSDAKPIRAKDIEQPHRLQANLQDDYINGVFDDYNFLFRACVVEVDYVGGKLAGPGTKRDDEPANPKGSLVARIFSRDRWKTTEQLTVFWPLFSHDHLPIKPGEHVYVMYEDVSEGHHGLWLTRIPEPATVDSPNLVSGLKKYEEGDPKNANAKAVCDLAGEPEKVEIPAEFVSEKVPSFRPRTGDRVIQGSNNTAIVMGRDRPSTPDSGAKQEAGTIDIVVGRAADENMNMTDDDSRMYVSMKTDIDANMEINDQFSEVSPPPGEALPSVGIKTDQFRVFARDSVKVVVNGNVGIAIDKEGNVFVEAAKKVEVVGKDTLDVKISKDIAIEGEANALCKASGDFVVEGANVFVGEEGASEHIIWGDAFFKELKAFLDILDSGPIGDLSGIPVITHPALKAGIATLKASLEKGVTMSSNHTVA